MKILHHNIIGISGKMGVGKDYISLMISEILRDKGFNPVILAIADLPKLLLQSAKANTYETLYVNKSFKTRTELKKLCADYKTMDVNYFVKKLSIQIDIFNSRGHNVFIISDIRFLNEVQFIQMNGGVNIRIIAPDRNLARAQYEVSSSVERDTGMTILKYMNHMSEIDLDKYNEFDFTLDNTNENSNFVIGNLTKLLKTLFVM